MTKLKNEKNTGVAPLINTENKMTNNNVGEEFLDDPKDKSGITLIALIITIIVMLILVAVTINVALDTGLFGTAKKGAYQTEVSTIKEQLEIAKVVKVAENGGKTPTDFGIAINDLGIEEKLKNKYGSKLVISEDGKLYYDSRIVTNEEEQGWLEEIGINKQDEILLKDYFLGKEDEEGNRPGKNLSNLIVSLESFPDIDFKDDTTTLEDETDIAYNINLLNLGLVEMDEDEKGAYYFYNFYIEYNNKAYAVRVKMNIETGEWLTSSVEYKYTPQGNEGKDLGEVTGEEKYNGWTILYDYGNGTVEAVSPETIGDLRLGYNDITINWEDETVKAEADIDGEEGLTNIEKAIYSYNHAIETINNYCKQQITDDIATDENVRSVGAKEDPIKDITIPENTITKNDIPNYNANDNDWFANYDGKGKVGDAEYEQDFVRMSYYGVENADYWSASRMCYVGVSGVYCSMAYIDTSGLITYSSHLWFVEADNSNTYSRSYAVRPVITVQIP